MKMSVSVFNPVHLTEFHIMKFPGVNMHHAQRTKPSLDRVRRDLFGPVDREECSRFAEEELAKQQLAASERWGFDFARGQPLQNQKIFLWERVPAEHEIPEMYTLSRAAHIRPIDDVTKSPRPQRRYNRSTAATSYMDLLDEHADELNRDITENELDLSFEDIEGGQSSPESSLCDEASFEETRNEKLLIDSMIDNISKNNVTHNVQSTSTKSATTVSSSSAFASSKEPMAIVSATVVRSTIQTRNCITSSNCKITGTNNGNSSNSNNNNISNNNNNKINNQNSCKNIRSSPRNREKRQPKITDYLKERKRLQPTPKKVSPKKARTSNNNEPLISTYMLRH